MAYLTKIQGCLRIGPDQGLPEDIRTGREYQFQKPGHRIYPINIPMNLFSRDWVPIAKIIITETTVGKNRTAGIFKVLIVYSEKQSAIIASATIPYNQLED